MQIGLGMVQVVSGVCNYFFELVEILIFRDTNCKALLIFHCK